MSCFNLYRLIDVIISQFMLLHIEEYLFCDYHKLLMVRIILFASSSIFFPLLQSLYHLYAYIVKDTNATTNLTQIVPATSGIQAPPTVHNMQNALTIEIEQNTIIEPSIHNEIKHTYNETKHTYNEIKHTYNEIKNRRAEMKHIQSEMKYESSLEFDNLDKIDVI